MGPIRKADATSMTPILGTMVSVRRTAIAIRRYPMPCSDIHAGTAHATTLRSTPSEAMTAPTNPTAPSPPTRLPRPIMAITLRTPATTTAIVNR